MKILLIIISALTITLNATAQVNNSYYVNNSGQKIHYKIVGEGPPLVLVFGFGMSLEAWFQFGYAQELANKFKVIAIDPRGHGKSDAPTKPSEYTLKKLSTDIISVLNQVNVKETYIFGYSLGAAIAMGVAKNNPQIVKGLIIGGLEIKPEFNPSNDIVISTLESGSVAWKKLWESLINVPAPMEKRLENINTEALLALRKEQIKWHTLKPTLKNLSIPTLLIAAKEGFAYEDMLKAHELLKNSQLITVPSMNHFTLIPNMKSIIVKIFNFIEKTT